MSATRRPPGALLPSTEAVSCAQPANGDVASIGGLNRRSSMAALTLPRHPHYGGRRCSPPMNSPLARGALPHSDAPRGAYRRPIDPASSGRPTAPPTLSGTLPRRRYAVSRRSSTRLLTLGTRSRRSGTCSPPPVHPRLSPVHISPPVPSLRYAILVSGAARLSITPSLPSGTRAVSSAFTHQRDFARGAPPPRWRSRRAARYGAPGVPDDDPFQRREDAPKPAPAKRRSKPARATRVAVAPADPPAPLGRRHDAARRRRRQPLVVPYDVFLGGRARP